ncbi:hemicentin-2-like [Amphibalanus amphitrite]|uniref:hemicentin-2-like n=1 Tax=Amphibalanus amphitrite TaxID=1232801 RepID=UPI001C91FD3D|nr:hemicentin-2-like [Amphibalanus amphitrite]
MAPVPVVQLVLTLTLVVVQSSDAWIRWDRFDDRCQQKSARLAVGTRMETEIVYTSPATALDGHAGRLISSRVTGGPYKALELCVDYGYAGHQVDVSTPPQVYVDTAVDVDSGRGQPLIRLTSPAVHRVPEGQRLELTCSAVGEPTVAVQWSGDAAFSALKAVPGRATGVFERVTAADAGRLTCRLVSGAVWLEQSVRLVVVPARHGTPPTIRPPDGGELEVNWGQPTELTCAATGDPTPSVDWLDPSQFSTVGAVGGRATGRIADVTLGHEGTYTCRAENHAGVVTAHLRLSIGGPCVQMPRGAPGEPPTFFPPGCAIVDPPGFVPHHETGPSVRSVGAPSVPTHGSPALRPSCIPDPPGPPGSRPRPLPPGCPPDPARPPSPPCRRGPPGGPTFVPIGCELDQYGGRLDVPPGAIDDSVLAVSPPGPVGPPSGQPPAPKRFCVRGPRGPPGSRPKFFPRGCNLPPGAIDDSELAGPGSDSETWTSGPSAPSTTYRPPSIRFDQSSVVWAEKGTDIALTCLGDGAPAPNITWLHRSRFSRVVEVPGRSTATLADVQPHHSLLYSCWAENEAGAALAWVRLVVYSPECLPSPPGPRGRPPLPPPSHCPLLPPCPPVGPPGSPSPPPHCRQPGPPSPLPVICPLPSYPGSPPRYRPPGCPTLPALKPDCIPGPGTGCPPEIPNPFTST